MRSPPPWGSTITDLHCLEILGRRGPLPASHLAAEAGLSRGALTTAVDRLERAGFAQRRGDPADSRRALVAVADARIRTIQPFAPLVSEALALHVG